MNADEIDFTKKNANCNSCCLIGLERYIGIVRLLQLWVVIVLNIIAYL